MTNFNASEIMNDMFKSSNHPWAEKTASATEQYQKTAAALNEEAQKNWHNPEWHREMATVISRTLDWSFRFENVLGSAIDVSTIGEDDQYVEEEWDGGQAFWTAKGAYIDETEIRNRRFTMGRDTIGFHVKEFEDKLRLNFAPAMSKMISVGEQAFEAAIWKRVYDVMDAAVGPSSDYYVTAGAGLTREILDTAIADVEDQLRPQNGLYPPVSIIGRRGAVDKISNVAVFGDGIFDPAGAQEIRQRGRLGSYHGASIVQIPNFYDVNRNSLLPNDELWVVGGSAAKLVYYGGTVTKSWNENTVDYTHYRSRRDVGVACWHPEYIRRIKLSEESS